MKLFSYSCVIFIFTMFSYAISYANDADMTNKYEDKINNLDPLQHYITQKNGTEQAFKNEYWNHKEEGIYVDVVSGEALFSSLDKYDSGSGWPSFTKPINGTKITEKTDNSLGVTRVEARSSKADSHLGHIFNDGPKEKGGFRYCINSGSLKFISKDKLIEEGYPEYAKLFEILPKGNEGYERAIVAGGCFWGVEELFKKFDGVIATQAGYIGGDTKKPTYNIVKTGTSGYAESVEIIFDPKKISYESILKYFFRIHDPTTLNRQGNDIGTQYRSTIFYIDNKQKNIAYNIIALAGRSGVFGDKEIVTKLEQAGVFYDAEEYHQDYLEKNPDGYTCHYIREKWRF